MMKGLCFVFERYNRKLLWAVTYLVFLPVNLRRGFLRFLLLPVAVLCIDCTAYGANRYWVGASTGNWNSTANWSGQSGGSSGASVPGAGDVAIFNSGGQANCTVNVNVTIQGVIISSSYNGTISLNPGISISITDSGFSQTGGTFMGNDGDILINGGFDVVVGHFTTNGILNIGDYSTPAPPPDIYMGFESNLEPHDEVDPRAPDPNGSGNGCLPPYAWNQYYVRDVCVSPTVELNHFAIHRSTSQYRSGNHSLRFYLKPTPLNQWPSGEATHRAELGPLYNSPVNHYPAEGEEVWYGMSYYFPDNFVFAPASIENEIRFVISQWQHGSGGSAIIALEVIGDKIMLQRQTGNSTGPTWITPDTIATIQRGQWMDFVVRVKWAKTGGIVQCWVNDQLQISLSNTQTVYNDLNKGGGFKMGIYYWRWKEKINVERTLDAGITHREFFMDEVSQYKGVDGYLSVVPGR